MSQQNNALFHTFRLTGLAEGVSFLVLLCIAMPLKYFANIPEAVKICGWIHGVLFVGFAVLAFLVMGKYNRSFGWLGKAILAALIPLGTFIFDRQLKKEEAAARA